MRKSKTKRKYTNIEVAAMIVVNKNRLINPENIGATDISSEVLEMFPNHSIEDVKFSIQRALDSKNYSLPLRLKPRLLKHISSRAVKQLVFRLVRMSATIPDITCVERKGWSIEAKKCGL